MQPRDDPKRGLFLPPFRRNTMNNKVPHKGALCRLEQQQQDTVYVIEIANHELQFTRHDFEFAQRLFCILDTESRGLVDRTTVQEFVTLRCPVFWRRDEDLRKLDFLSGCGNNKSPTFDEIWKSVAMCSKTTLINDHDDDWELGVEGWMVFCRFIALAQYLEAKRRFSARHLQQTMRHRNSPRGSEVVVVDVPPPEPPAPLSPEQLANYEQKSKAPLPLPELDLDHSLLAAHDSNRRRPAARSEQGMVKISLFGSSFSDRLLSSSSSTSSHSGNLSNLEFAVTYARSSSLEDSSQDPVVVRRSMADMKWLDDTFTSHKVLGGTLCGRILPPFPGSGNRVLSTHFPTDDYSSVLNSHTTNSAIAAAAAGVGRIKSVAKSFIGSYLGPAGVAGSLSMEEATGSSNQTNKKPAKKKSSVPFAVDENYYNPNSPIGKARHLERYLNYLLEHPALSTSFPLNTILKASQSGLEGAKKSLEDCNRASKEIQDQTPQLDDGKMMSLPSQNMAWVRTAAQAAMALKVHGMLETTGMQSASARLQHASLPSFGPSARSSGWDDDDAGAQARAETVLDEASTNSAREGNNFEEGVVNVQSELASGEELFGSGGDDGYDLLPLPVPAPERRILSAGSDARAVAEINREERFHYGTATIEGRQSLDTDEDDRSAFLGEIAVDENIDKLREVIGSVDNTLSRCLASSGAIGKAQRERQGLHLDVVRGLDTWEGMRGRFVAQRALLKGVAGIDQSKEIYDESNLALIDDISWQTSLANSAVSAAEDVRSAVRVSRTASNAKAAASAAAMAAQNACETGVFATMEEARAAQTRASIAQGHAMRAAVVEHEAKTVKRRATLGLAHDVKCWNVHRKREMLHSCIAYARSQHEATRRAVDAWSSLCDGFIGSTVIPSERRSTPLPCPPPPASTRLERNLSDQDEVTATIFEELASAGGDQPSIVAVDHDLLTFPPEVEETAEGEEPTEQEEATEVEEPKKPSFELPETDSILPFATADPIPEEEDDEEGSPRMMEAKQSSSFHDAAGDISANEDVLSASMQSLVDGLMNWGGGFDAEEDFALPAGMAASIALEENGAMGPTKIA